MGYAENMYQWLKRNGYADKYDHAGIYCIKIDNMWKFNIHLDFLNSYQNFENGDSPKILSIRKALEND